MSSILDCWLCLLVTFVLNLSGATAAIFDDNYEVTWGNDHVNRFNGGKEVQLYMDQSSGAGFSSKSAYGSGLFHMRIKLPSKDSAGIVTAYYLSSSTYNHDELDFEFLGNKEGRPIILQTNIYMNGQGNREQRMYLWFDPTADFHDYTILWNPFQVIFFVDEKPIRVLKNQTSKGAEFPSQPMKVIASLWNGDSWATDGGHTKTNWTHAPFIAHFQGFDLAGCKGSNMNVCSYSSLWWNQGRYKELSPAQKADYDKVKKNYVTYDYCNDGKISHPTPRVYCSLTPENADHQSMLTRKVHSYHTLLSTV